MYRVLTPCCNFSFFSNSSSDSANMPDNFQKLRPNSSIYGKVAFVYK
jgi:hypothetical protein